MSFTLCDVINQVPNVANFKSSEFMAPYGASVVQINGQNYELRFFIFQGAGTLTFNEFIKQSNLENQAYSEVNPGYAALKYFSQTPDLAKQNIYYTLSLREM